MTYDELGSVIEAMTPEQQACPAMAFFPIGDSGGYFMTVQALDPLERLPGELHLTKRDVPDDQRFMVSVKRSFP